MSFDDFIFHEELREELSFLVNNPERIPSPLCFYGHPGNGKTTFARYLADSVARTTDYFDMNTYKANGESSGKALSDIQNRAVTQPLLGEGIWTRAVILDEWHDMPNKQQDAYKVPFEEYSKSNRCLFIICANTQVSKGIDTVLTPAIRSRCYTISFNTPRSKAKEVKKEISDRFPDIPTAIIESKFPDMRQIQKIAQLR